jgi:hypothetical protein
MGERERERERERENSLCENKIVGVVVRLLRRKEG